MASRGARAASERERVDRGDSAAGGTSGEEGDSQPPRSNHTRGGPRDKRVAELYRNGTQTREIKEHSLLQGKQECREDVT